MALANNKTRGSRVVQLLAPRPLSVRSGPRFPHHRPYGIRLFSTFVGSYQPYGTRVVRSDRGGTPAARCRSGWFGPPTDTDCAAAACTGTGCWKANTPASTCSGAATTAATSPGGAAKVEGTASSQSDRPRGEVVPKENDSVLLKRSRGLVPTRATPRIYFEEQTWLYIILRAGRCKGRSVSISRFDLCARFRNVPIGFFRL
eukprot:663622-Prorocentrum_minimum.AAC.1